MNLGLLGGLLNYKKHHQSDNSRTRIFHNGVSVLARNGMLLESQVKEFLPPKRIGSSRFYCYTAADKTYRIARVGKPYKVPPATPAMFAPVEVPKKKTTRKAKTA